MGKAWASCKLPCKLRSPPLPLHTSAPGTSFSQRAQRAGPPALLQSALEFWEQAEMGAASSLRETQLAGGVLAARGEAHEAKVGGRGADRPAGVLAAAKHLLAWQLAVSARGPRGMALASMLFYVAPAAPVAARVRQAGPLRAAVAAAPCQCMPHHLPPCPLQPMAVLLHALLGKHLLRPEDRKALVQHTEEGCAAEDKQKVRA